ncbi:LPXTG cell wall anchor domain-containing protein [Streptomyces sp. SID8014]|uniref:SCO1860 family LAETG-anchored protein n=1 Tax=Streptomyces sp. SID8014 TaxID=2706097 RepID=UPI0013BDD7C9|nr:SCO1860 family LAETG-anchored protein [Streptomyces sp. SID8014]NEC10833.1 LPXTG cell wall anchor domain-containing protein [Streptomyces sp. SID8014]
MNSTNFRMPARRLVAASAAGLLAAAPLALASAGTAHATGDHGRADAVVLRTGLDVSLLNKTLNVPLKVALNEVHAPQTAEKTALDAELSGVNDGEPFSVLSAQVAEAKATADAHKAEGHTTLAHAKVHLPGLPALPLLEVEKVTSTALCEAGKKPVAEANVLGQVVVLGKRVGLTAGGTTEVKVPGVGEVSLDLSERHTTTSTAAATALELKVSVNPLKLGVAEVDGTVTLGGATCEAPAAPAPAPEEEEPAEEPAAEEQADKPADGSHTEQVKTDDGISTQTGKAPATENLAETGGSSMTPYLAGGAVLLLAAGGGAVALTRRKRA